LVADATEFTSLGDVRVTGRSVPALLPTRIVGVPCTLSRCCWSLAAACFLAAAELRSARRRVT
jgi:hypothetical protein